MVIFKYVWIGFSSDASAKLRAIELRSKLLASSLMSAHWIKPIQCHAEGKRSAHVIARFASPEEEYMHQIWHTDRGKVCMGQMHEEGAL